MWRVGQLNMCVETIPFFEGINVTVLEIMHHFKNSLITVFPLYIVLYQIYGRYILFFLCFNISAMLVGDVKMGVVGVKKVAERAGRSQRAKMRELQELLAK